MDDAKRILPLKAYRDDRGVLKKILMLSQLEEGQIEEVYLLYTNSGCVRGNHYHLRTTEYFTVVQGEARIALADWGIGGGEEFTLSAEEDKVVHVPAGVIHAFKNDTQHPLIMLAISTREYDSLESDTYSRHILE